MQKLTDEAREYCLEVVGEINRETMVEMLEGIGCACYDDEDISDFIEAIVDSIEAGDIEFDFGIHAAKNQKHHMYMKWLDIDDVWQ